MAKPKKSPYKPKAGKAPASSAATTAVAEEETHPLPPPQPEEDLIDPAELVRQAAAENPDEPEDDDEDEGDEDDEDEDEGDEDEEASQTAPGRTGFNLGRGRDDEEDEDEGAEASIQRLLNTQPGTHGTTLDDPTIPNENVAYTIRLQDDPTVDLKYGGVATRQELREFAWERTGGKPGNYSVQQLMGKSTGGGTMKKTRFWYEKILDDPKKNPLPGVKPRAAEAPASQAVPSFGFDPNAFAPAPQEAPSLPPLSAVFGTDSNSSSDDESDDDMGSNGMLMRFFERMDEREEQRRRDQAEFNRQLLAAMQTRPAEPAKNSLKETLEMLEPVIKMVAEPLGKLISGQTEGIKLGLELARDAERPKFMDMAAAALMPVAIGMANQQQMLPQHAAPAQQAPQAAPVSTQIAPRPPAQRQVPAAPKTPAAKSPQPRSETEEWMWQMGRALAGNNERLLAWDYWARRVIAEASDKLVGEWATAAQDDAGATALATKLAVVFNRVTAGLKVDAKDREQVGGWMRDMLRGINQGWAALQAAKAKMQADQAVITPPAPQETQSDAQPDTPQE